MAIQVTHAKEKGTYVVTMSFTDADETAVTPTSATWTWTDLDGTVINSRSAVNIAALDTSVSVVLSGDDLAIQSGEGESDPHRIFTVEAVYNSATYGNSLPLKDSTEIVIDQMVAVS